MSVQDPPRPFPSLQPSKALPERKARGPLPKAVVALVFAIPCLILIAAAALVWVRPDAGRLDAAAATARHRVVQIVNRPVKPFPRRTTAREYSPGWFHEGAIKPDFNTVDVRATQEFPYQAYPYVTSDVNPSTMFRGKDLEFNAMTKFFYVDRNLPKRRLSQHEMVEINSLYRVIGRAEQAAATRWETVGGLLGSAFFMVLAMLFQLRRRS